MALRGTDLESQPSQITIAQMVALGTGFTALTLFGTSELLEFAVKLLNRSTPGVHVSNGLRVDGVWSIGDNPVNVAVCGDYLEQSNFEGQLFEFDHHAVLEAVACPVNILKMNVALFTAQRDQAVVLDRGEKDHIQEGNQLEVGNAGVPAIEQHRAGLNALAGFGRHQHLTKQVILGAAINGWRVNSVVYWVEVFSVVMHQVHDVDAPHQAVFGSAVLPLHQADV